VTYNKTFPLYRAHWSTVKLNLVRDSDTAIENMSLDSANVHNNNNNNNNISIYTVQCHQSSI